MVAYMNRVNVKRWFFVLLVSQVFLNACFAIEIPTDLISTQSGLKYKVLKKGTGPRVQPNREVGFHWTGYYEDGRLFDTSIGKEPFYFVTGQKQVIAGAEEGLAMMRVGDRYLFVMPPELAYGSKGSGESIPPNSTLVFDYEVVSVAMPKMSIHTILLELIEKEGIQAAIKHYHALKNDSQEIAQYSFRENELNNLGYQLINKKRIDEAIQILTLNTDAYPDSWNAYDSLAEAYLIKGDQASSLRCYKKSVELNPASQVGLEKIKALELDITHQ